MQPVPTRPLPRGAKFAAAILGAVAALGCASGPAAPGMAPGWSAQDSETLVRNGTPIAEIPARNPDGSVNVLVEIPAGTNAKWELRKQDGALAWERRDGRPRVVRYLPYPANYGMIPGTLLATADGGDGDPLDVVVLGPAVPRGSVQRTRVIGVLRLLDGGEQDHKLLAVAQPSPFEDLRDMATLEADFPGVLPILETWFGHYKGAAGLLEVQGFAEAAVALEILERALLSKPAP